MSYTYYFAMGFFKIIFWQSEQTCMTDPLSDILIQGDESNMIDHWLQSVIKLCENQNLRVQSMTKYPCQPNRTQEHSRPSLLTQQRGRILLLRIVVHVSLAQPVVQRRPDPQYELREEDQKPGHDARVGEAILVGTALGLAVPRADRQVALEAATGDERAGVEVLPGEDQGVLPGAIDEVGQREDETRDGTATHADGDPARPVTRATVVDQQDREDLRDLIARENYACVRPWFNVAELIVGWLDLDMGT